MQVILRYRRLLIVVTHLALTVLTNYLAFWLRFDGEIPRHYLDLLFQALPWLVALRGLAFVPFRLYGGLWRYTGIWDLGNIVAGVSCSTVGFYLLVRWGFGITRYPRSVFIVDAVLLIFFMGGIRLAMRAFRESSGRYRHKVGKRAVIVGAGDAGDMLLREIGKNTAMPYEIVGFVDDEPRKRGMRIHGVEVLGTVD